MQPPETRYARSGDVSIAYQVSGDGPFDVVFVPGFAVLFTDIVGATATAAELGDRRRRELLADHHALVRRELARFRGRELELRAGLHTGECEVVDGKVGGIAVHIGARVAARAGPGRAQRGPRLEHGQGSRGRLGLQFEDRGAAELKGVPGEWRLYAVAR
ncbi:MAG TPA: hypothetical protein VGJ25_15540 [Gaiellaceae bacterium]